MSSQQQEKDDDQQAISKPKIQRKKSSKKKVGDKSSPMTDIETTSRQSKQKTKKKKEKKTKRRQKQPAVEVMDKCVQFASKVTCIPTIHLNEYTPKEYQKTYYNQIEIQAMREDVDYTVEMMKLRMKIDEVHESTRGVDCTYTPKAIKRRIRRIKAAYAAAFSPTTSKPSSILSLNISTHSRSTLGSMDDEDDDIIVAKAYSKAVQESVEAGLQLGRLDEEFVLLHQADLEDDPEHAKEGKKKEAKAPNTIMRSKNENGSTNSKGLLGNMLFGGSRHRSATIVVR